MLAERGELFKTLYETAQRNRAGEVVDRSVERDAWMSSSRSLIEGCSGLFAGLNPPLEQIHLLRQPFAVARHRARAQPPEDSVRDGTHILERRQIEVARQ